MKCPHCQSENVIIDDIIFAQNQFIKATHCLCGWYECPPENYDLMVINRTVFNAAEKIRNRHRKKRNATRTYYGGLGRW